MTVDHKEKEFEHSIIAHLVDYGLSASDYRLRHPQDSDYYRWEEDYFS